MTPQDAREKICPFVTARRERNGVLGEGKLSEQCACVSVNCMAWNWHVDDDGSPLKPQGAFLGDGYCGRIPLPREG